jgi:TPR repeat protein
VKGQGILDPRSDIVTMTHLERHLGIQLDMRSRDGLRVEIGIFVDDALGPCCAPPLPLVEAGAGDADSEFQLGLCYVNGEGVPRDFVNAVKWFRKAAEQNYAQAQYNLGVSYAKGEGVAKDYVEAYTWWFLAAGQGNEAAKYNMTMLENEMTREQIAEGQKLARNFKPRRVPSAGSDSSSTGVQSRPKASGSGFFITEDGYLHHK